MNSHKAVNIFCGNFWNTNITVSSFRDVRGPTIECCVSFTGAPSNEFVGNMAGENDKIQAKFRGCIMQRYVPYAIRATQLTSPSHY